MLYFFELFVQSLKEDARDWFSYFPVCSISSWNDFMEAFIKQFGERIDPFSVRQKIMNIQKEENELVQSFNLTFAKAVRDISRDVDKKMHSVWLYI